MYVNIIMWYTLNIYIYIFKKQNYSSFHSCTTMVTSGRARDGGKEGKES